MRVRAKEVQDDTLDDLSDEDLIEYFRDTVMGDPNQPDYAQIYDAQEDDDRRLQAYNPFCIPKPIHDSTLEQRLAWIKFNGAIDVVDSAGNWIYDNWWEAPDELSCIELQRYSSVSLFTTLNFTKLRIRRQRPDFRK